MAFVKTNPIESMATVNFKGNPVSIKGDIPSVGEAAPDFTFVKKDLSEAKLSDYAGKVKVILAVPSLDTGVCAMETEKFNSSLAGNSSVEAVVVSKDLPFAMGRFCELQGIQNVTSGSDFRYNEFTQRYNTEMTDGPLKGLSSRAVFVVDQGGTIQYSELVPEITQEPEYDKALEVVTRLS